MVQSSRHQALSSRLRVENMEGYSTIAEGYSTKLEGYSTIAEGNSTKLGGYSTKLGGYSGNARLLDRNE